MGQVSTSIEIPVTADAVWDLVITPASYDRWMTTHTKWKGDVPGRFSVGDKADEVVTMLGMANTISWTVDEVEEGRHLRISGTGMAGVRSQFDFDLEPAGDGCRVSIDASFEGQMVVGALGKAVEKDARQQLDASLAKLQDVLGQPV